MKVPLHQLAVPLLITFALAACSDATTSPTEFTSVDGPLSLVAPGIFGNVTTLNAAGTPSGGHIQSGSPIYCLVEGDFDVVCSGNGPYEIAGVGNANGQADLSASYEATVNCTNNGGKLVPVKSQAATAPASTGELETKNGRLAVPVISTEAPSDVTFLAAATCPNGNWTKSLAGGDPVLVSFLYTLTFAGFVTPSISIAAS